MLKWLGGSTSSASAGSNSSGNGTDNFTHLGKAFTVNEYQVIVEELIAEGGFAVVYKTRSNKGKTYALKRMAVNNDHDLYLAKQEIAITKALSDCPYSVTFVGSSIHSISPDVHEVLILLHLYTGPSVVDLLNSRLAKKTTLSEQEVMKIFSNVVVAVGRLHHRTKPIIHRDLKIENILSDSAGNYVLCDYGSCSVSSMHPESMGASRCEDEIARFTTLAYRAPEMVSLYSGKTITTKADIWALGCLLYKLCFMTTPFGEQPLAIVSAQFTIPENSPYSEDLHSLIRYMLEPDSEKRPNIWQISEVVCRMQGKKNILPNVFRSPKPPAVLPRARRANENKPTPSSTESKQKPLQSTPNPKAKNMTKVTTTSISSRERPRARGTALGSTPSSTTSASSSASHIPLIRQHSSSPPARPRPTSRLEVPENYQTQNLRVDSQLSAQSKSWDSGLDMFGAVPFSTPAEQAPTLSSESPNNTNFEDVRRDLFGSTPFTYATSTHKQHSRHSHTAATQPVDDFGATPFVTCS